MVKKTISKRTDHGSEQFLFRLPDGMRKQLAEVAEHEGRTMSSVIVVALAMYFESQRPPAADIKTELKELRDRLGNLEQKLGKADAAVSRPADDMADMEDRLDRILDTTPKKK
jgi:predicted DNA-binding protein